MKKILGITTMITMITMMSSFIINDSFLAPALEITTKTAHDIQK